MLAPARPVPRVRLARVLGYVALGLLLMASAATFAAHAYYPRLLYPAPRSDPESPAEGKLLTLRARDGAIVHATELAGPAEAPVIVYFHGNGVVVGDDLWMAREFVRRGLGVVLCEYRGYGLSVNSSAPSEAGLYDDAEAVLVSLAERGIGRDRIMLLGESLGSGVASEMAARGLGAALVLVTPYTSIPEVASRFVFGLPVRWLMRERFDSLAKAARITVPTLLLHGTADEVVPYDMGVRLAATFPRARLITIAGGHHNDLFLGDGWRLFDEVVRFSKLSAQDQ